MTREIIYFKSIYYRTQIVLLLSGGSAHSTPHCGFGWFRGRLSGNRNRTDPSRGFARFAEQQDAIAIPLERCLEVKSADLSGHGALPFCNPYWFARCAAGWQGH